LLLVDIEKNHHNSIVLVEWNHHDHLSCYLKEIIMVIIIIINDIISYWTVSYNTTCWYTYIDVRNIPFMMIYRVVLYRIYDTYLSCYLNKSIIIIIKSIKGIISSVSCCTVSICNISFKLNHHDCNIGNCIVLLEIRCLGQNTKHNTNNL
jgi:hypothetical protein